MAKIILMISIFFSLSLVADTSIFEHKVEKPSGPDNKQLCELFTDKAIKYQKTMRDDEYAQVTLQSYKDRAAPYCQK